MAAVTIYTRSGCGYCRRALELLHSKGASVVEIDAGRDEKLRQEMIDRAGGRWTFPQIFIGARHVGGCDDLHALDRDGRLDPLLEAAS